MQLKKRHRKACLTAKRRCYYCGDVLTRRSASIDHMVPKSRGGSDDPDNKCTCCKACNNEKDHRDVEAYRRFLQDKLANGQRIVFFGERFVRGKAAA